MCPLTAGLQTAVFKSVKNGYLKAFLFTYNLYFELKDLCSPTVGKYSAVFLY